MELNTQYKLKESIYYKYLKENSNWYKYLNRNYTDYNKFIDYCKNKYELKRTNKINKALSNIDMITSILDLLK